MDVPMELARILITEMSDKQIIFLREKDGQRTFPIVIGSMEALAIDRRLKNIPVPRPMTHDLLATVIEAMGGSIEKIVINDLRDHTFFATIYIQQNGQDIEIDSRPSDAIALGAAYTTPIFVAEHVLDEVMNEAASHLDKIELLRQRMEMLSQGITELTEQLEDQQHLSTASPETIKRQRRQLAEMKNEYEQIERVLRKLE